MFRVRDYGLRGLVRGGEPRVQDIWVQRPSFRRLAVALRMVRSGVLV